jgi:chitodextrinase
MKSCIRAITRVGLVPMILLVILPAASQAASVTLRWTAPGDDGSVGTAAQYDVRYATGAITAGNWGSATQAANEPAPKVAGSAETFTITNLAANTTYYFAVKAADEATNWSNLSNVVSVTTGDETAPAAIADLTASPQ